MGLLWTQHLLFSLSFHLVRSIYKFSWSTVLGSLTNLKPHWQSKTWFSVPVPTLAARTQPINGAELRKVLRHWKAKALKLPGAEGRMDSKSTLIDCLPLIAAQMMEQEVAKRLAQTQQFSEACTEITRALRDGKNATDLLPPMLSTNP